MGLPLLRFLYRKMWNTRWLTLSALAGLIMAVAFSTSIPMYADGSLKRVVGASLQEENSGLPAGAVLMRYQAVGSERPNVDDVQEVNSYIEESVPDQIGFPFHNYVRSYSLRNARVTPVDKEAVDASKRRQMTLQAMSGLDEHIELTNGRMFADTVQNDTIEAIVLNEAMYRNYFQVGDEFLYPVQGGGRPLTIKVVGSFEAKAPTDPNDVYWYQGLDSFVNAFLISEQVFETDLLDRKNVPLDMANWYYNFDLTEIKTSQLSPLADTLDRLNIELYQRLKNTRVDISFQKMLEDFKRQSIHLQTLLFTLAAPMLAMVFYYIGMNSRQALDRQRTDISVLRSRGASTRQIIAVFLLEGLILGAVAMIIGPMIGWFMAKSIGSSSGFLQFVNRKAIPVDVSWNTLLYGLVAVAIALSASLIPAIQYARASIVNLKQQMARADRKPFWQRWYLDIVLLALCGYGYYSFNNLRFMSLRTGLSSDQLQVQPLLFFVPALTIFALGLFFLRLFPWLLKLFNLLGKRFLPVPIYLTLTQLSRSATAYYPLMLLLILTLGLGVYNSSSARTIDLNSTEQTLYRFGSDVTVQTVWEANIQVQPQNPNPGGGDGGNGGGDGGNGGGNGGGGNPGNGGQTPPPIVRYMEPPFEVFKELPGVEASARVLKTNGYAVVSGRTAGQMSVMGIDNVDFSKVAWFRDGNLLPGPHQNEYLNAMGAYEQSVIIPDSFAERYQLQPGDLLTITIDQQAIEFVIVATTPYWPTQYPSETPFAIVNLDYVYDQVPMIPYEVWLNMEDGAPVTPVVETLQEKGIQLASIQDVRIELATLDRHPSRGGVFGILSLGFLVSVIVSLVGYILYWFFNLSSRILQFGVLRAMGLSRRQLTGMLLLEQVFTAGLSILLGFGLGKLASYLYLPFLQTSENARTQVPPFRVVFEARDELQLYIVIGVMMMTGAGLLFLHIRRLRVHQAVKLGEER